MSDQPAWDEVLNDALSGATDDKGVLAPLVDTQLRILVSMRGHLNALLQLAEEVAEAVRTEDSKELKRLQHECYAYLTEAQLHGVNSREYPSLPASGEPITVEVLEKIVGKQRFRVAAREAKKLR